VPRMVSQDTEVIRIAHKQLARGMDAWLEHPASPGI